MKTMSKQNFPAPLDAAMVDCLFSSYPIHVAITGGGGKTSLMYCLADSLAKLGKRTISTTTTHIRLPLPEESPLLIQGKLIASQKLIVDALKSYRHITWVAEKLREDKLRGDTLEAIDFLFSLSLVDALLVEADGARGFSLKGYTEHEPVIPRSITHHFVVVGADVLGNSISDDNTFRIERVRDFTGSICPVLDAALLIKLLDSEAMYLRNSPSRIRRELFINKAELLDLCKLNEWSKQLSASLCHYDRISFVSFREKRIYFSDELEHNRLDGKSLYP